MVAWNTIMSCCMQPFCLLVDKILSCCDLETSDFSIFSEIWNQKILTVGARSIQASQFCSVWCMDTSVTVCTGHGAEMEKPIDVTATTHCHISHNKIIMKYIECCCVLTYICYFAYTYKLILSEIQHCLEQKHFERSHFTSASF